MGGLAPSACRFPNRSAPPGVFVEGLRNRSSVSEFRIRSRSCGGEGVYRYKAADRTFEYPLISTIGGYRVRSQFTGYSWGMTLVAFYDPNVPEHGGLVLERKIEGFEIGAPIFLGFGSVCLLGGMAGFVVILRQRINSTEVMERLETQRHGEHRERGRDLTPSQFCGLRVSVFQPFRKETP